MQTAQNYAQKAKSAYATAATQTRDCLETIFGPKFFLPIQDRVKTLADACEIIGKDPNDPYYHVGDPKDCARHRLVAQMKALGSEHPKLSFKNKQQEKWYPVFIWDGTAFRFYAAFYDITVTYAGAGSGLCLPNEELTKYHATQFQEDWNIWLAEED